MVPASGSSSGSAELISGPDLGAGFLHQLTRERDGGRTRFTFHAQDGAEDAGGPPRGTPEPLGWRLAPGMCPIGGRRCWHREFEAADADTAVVRAAYQRTRLVLELSIDQALGRTTPSWEAAFAETAERVEIAARADPFPWALSAVSVAPRSLRPAPAGEIVLVTSRAGVAGIGAALREYLIEPPAPTDWSIGRVLAGRAFVGTPREGARVGWRAIGGEEDRDVLGNDDPRRGALPATLSWAGRSVAVSSR